MRRMFLLLGLVLCLSAAAHAGEPASLDGFLAELAIPSPDASQAPEAIPAASCYVSKDCVCGGGYVTIDCSGEVSCQVRPRAVVCDGYWTYCPPIGSCPV